MSWKESVIELAIKNGFIIEGETQGLTARIGNAAIGYKIATYPSRVRLILNNTDWRMTVGKQTVCIYKVKDRKACDFNNFKPTETEDIQNFIDNIKREC